MDEVADFHKYLLLTSDSFRKLWRAPEQPLVNSELEAPNANRVSIRGQDAFMAPASFRPEVDFRSTRFWDSQGGTETVVTEGGVRGGNSLVAEPGMGSLTITGSTGEVVGAESDELGAVSGTAGPPGFGVGQSFCRGTGGEVGAAELTSMMNSGMGRRRYAIIIIIIIIIICPSVWRLGNYSII